MMRFLGQLCRITGALTLLAVLVAVPLFFTAGHWMQVHDEPRQADYILPLAGDTHRNLFAADLFKQGFAPTILLSLPASSPPSPLSPIYKKLGYPHFGSNENFLRAFYAELGVPDSALASFGKGHLSTVEESENLRKYLGPGKHTLLLVTSPYHARRAKLIFERTFPESEIIMTTTPYEHFEERWWADYYTAPKVVLEATKCLYYVLGGVFRAADLAAP